MELRRELLLTIGGLVVLSLLLAFGAIGLFLRMGPAIARILQENGTSIEAAEDMLAELAGFEGVSLPDDVQARIRESLQRAKDNVTEDEERPVLASVERHLSLAMSGDLQARRQVIADLRQLIRVNRHSMKKSDQEARHLGGAGAWTAVLFGFASFVFGLIAMIRLERRFIRPFTNLHEVLASAHQGDRLRRCRLCEAPREVVQVMESVNALLDQDMGSNTRTTHFNI